ncbi:hypothetical protein CBR_g31815 [Chara braunii]|uniref:Reverse transcriptase domain-containing protein n=1 Tax=Chara braunii TaxID=69332 RepID=A0A388LFQ8_CHABU|nr:hypothetical protein CBR_g31815 [Chara braunii]|eukprot:GBG81139.1 hypothetical protein CBR_g31815 [Chara braunii]
MTDVTDQGVGEVEVVAKDEGKPSPSTTTPPLTPAQRRKREIEAKLREQQALLAEAERQEAAKLEAATDASREEFLLQKAEKAVADERVAQITRYLAELVILQNKITTSHFTNWDDRIQCLETRMDDLAAQQNKILDSIQNLTAQLTAANLISVAPPSLKPKQSSPHPSPPPSPHSSRQSSPSTSSHSKVTPPPTYAVVTAGDQRGPKIPAPSKFRGDDPKTDVGDWAAGTRAYLKGFVCLEQQKEATIVGLLEGLAQKWAASIASGLQQSLEDWASDLGLGKLLQALEERFADKERARKAADKITRLGQQRYSGTLQSLFAKFEQLTSTPRLVMSDDDLLTNFCRAVPEKFSIALYNAGHKDWRSFGRAALDMEWLKAVNPRIDWQIPKVELPDSKGVYQPCMIAVEHHPKTSCFCLRAREFYALSRQYDHERLFLALGKQTDAPTVSCHPEIQQVVDQYADQMKELFGLPNRPTKHHIELLPGAVPPKGRVYRMSPVELEELRRQLETLTSKGWIRPSTSEFGARVLFVPKGNCEFRMCIDYRGLNKIIRKSTKPLPRIDDLLDMVQGCTVFSKVDLKSGYHQIEMAKEDVYKTTFKTRYGTYEFLVMPFGLCNAPGTFQTEMHRIFKPYLDKFMVVYLDDILVFSKTTREHAEHLTLVLQSLQNHQYKINREKSFFGVPSVIYLGHVISGDGLAPEEAKIAAIQEWPQPQTVRDVRSFFGLASYYRKFVRNFSAVAAPLTNLTKKDTPFLWSLHCQMTFARLKQALTRAPALKLSDPTLPFVLTTDASQYGIGAVLQQDDGNGLRPVEFMSKKIKTQKLQDSTYEKELYALVSALKHWKHFLLGRHFKIFSDHSTLQWMKSQGELNDKLARYIQFIDMFDFELKHKKGCYNKVADALSRRPDSFALISSTHSFGEETCQTIARLLPQDPTYGPIVRNLQADPNSEPGYVLSSDLLYTYSRGEERLCIPQDQQLRTLLMSECHDARRHFGFLKSYAALSQRFFWKEMQSDMLRYVETCELCQRNKVQHLGKTTPRGMRLVMVCVDRFSKYAEFIPLPEVARVPAVRAAFSERWVTHDGPPTSNVSDRDPRFCSDEWQSYCKDYLHSRLDMTSGRHPEANGQAEVMNQIMATHDEGHSAGGSCPLGEQHRRGGLSGEEPRGAQRLWCDYNKRIWYVDWACQDASKPLKPRCGPVLFLAGRGNTIRLAGSFLNWTEVGADILRITLRKLYRSDGSVDEVGEGCNVSGKMFGGYDQRVMALPFFVPLAPGHDEAVHVKDLLEVWSRRVSPSDGMDVDPGTSMRGPFGFAGADPVGGELGLPRTPPDPKRVGGGDDMPKDSSAQRRTGESSGKRSKSAKEKKGDEGETGEGDEDVEVNLNVFNLDNAFFLEMKTGVQKDVVLHIHPERILHIPDREDAYNHRSLDEFLVDTIAAAMIDCYERQDMRYTKPTFVLALIVVPPEKDKPAVRVLPQDFNASHPEKYWYYPVCGQHNARAVMKVKDHVVFNYYTFYEWPCIPIYFPDDEFDGYAHVSCEDNLKDKKNPPRLQILSMQDIRNIWKIRGKPHVVLDNVSKKKEEVHRWTQFMALAMKKTPYTPLWGLSTEAKKKKDWAEKLQYYLPLAMADDLVFDLAEKFYEEWLKRKLLASDSQRWTEKSPTHEEVAKPGLSTMTDSQGLKKHVWYVKVDDPSLRKGKGKPKKGGEEKTYYVQVPEPDVHCWKELADLTDREKRRLLNGILNLNVVWVQGSNKKLAEQGKFSVKEMVDIIKIDRIMLRLWHYVEFEHEEMGKEQWNDALRKLAHQLRSHTCVLDLSGTVDQARWDAGAFASLSEFLGIVCHDYWTLVVFVPCLWNLSFMASLSALRATRCYTGKWVRKTQVKKTHQFGNSMWEKSNVMHILFKGDDPLLLTQPVYEGAVAEDDAAALRRKQKVTPMDVVEHPFKCLYFADIGNLTQRGTMYKDWERNPFQLCSRLHFFCAAADAVLFLGKPHAQVVWNLLQSGRHVLAVEGDSAQLEYTVQFVAHEVTSEAYDCDFHQVTMEPEYDPNKDMFFKLTPKKRRQVYSFLFGNTPKWRVDEDYVRRKEVCVAGLQGHHGASGTNAVDVHDPADFTLDKYRLAFGEDDDFNIETEKEESVEDDLFDFDGQLAIFNAQVLSKSPSVCKPRTPLSTPTSGGPTPLSSAGSVKRGGLSRLTSPLGESLRITPLPGRLQPGQQVPPGHPHLLHPTRPYHLGDKHTFSKAEDWGHDIVWHPDHFQPVLLNSEWAVAARNVAGGWDYDDRWDLDVFKVRAYEAVVQRLVEVNGKHKDDPALRSYADTLFDFLQTNKWLECSAPFYSLPSSPSLNSVSWQLPSITPRTEAVKRKSRRKDDEGDGHGGGRRGSGGGSEPRSSKRRSPEREGGGEGRKGSGEKKKLHSGEKRRPHSGAKKKHHSGDGQGSNVDEDDDGATLAVTCSTSIETGNDFTPGKFPRPGEQDSVISSTCATHISATCPAKVRTQFESCLGLIRSTKTTSLSGTQRPVDSETTTYLGSDCDNQEPFSVPPDEQTRINPNLEALSFKTGKSVDPIRSNPEQEDVSTTTADWCKETEMLCTENPNELQGDRSSFEVGGQDKAMKSLEIMTSPIVDADISNLSSFSGGLEHVVAASTCTGLPVMLGLPAVDFADVEPEPGRRTPGETRMSEEQVAPAKLFVLVAGGTRRGDVAYSYDGDKKPRGPPVRVVMPIVGPRAKLVAEAAGVTEKDCKAILLEACKDIKKDNASSRSTVYRRSRSRGDVMRGIFGPQNGRSSDPGP